jgi:tetratricopeptide (TPR) repeat protein
MTPREALAAAEQTESLAGARVRMVGLGVWLASAAVVSAASALGVSLAAMAIGGGSGTCVVAGAVTGAVVAIASMSALSKWTVRSGEAHNRAWSKLTTGRLDEAVLAFREFLTTRTTFHAHAALGLQNLGIIALWRGKLEEAAKLLRASIAVDHARRLGWSGPHGGQQPGDLALVLACLGDLDGATLVLDEHAIEGATPFAVAHAARSRALVALKRGDARGAIDLVDAHHRLFRNTLRANDAALVSSIESVARRARGDVAHTVVVDPEARAYVLRALPEAASLLAAD